MHRLGKSRQWGTRHRPTAEEDWVSPWQDASAVCVEQGSLTAIAGINFDELVVGVESDN